MNTTRTTTTVVSNPPRPLYCGSCQRETTHYYDRIGVLGKIYVCQCCGKEGVSKIKTLVEFDRVVETLTPFQKRVFDAIKLGPNEMANTWEICWNGFTKEWNSKRSAHGAMFRCVLQAGIAMQEKGIVVILSPRDEHDTYTFCSIRDNIAYREKLAVERKADAIDKQREATA